MFWRRKRPKAPPHPRLVELEVRTGLRTLSRHDLLGEDEVVEALQDHGISPERAWKLALLLPSALAHVVIEGIGIPVPETFQVVADDHEPVTRAFGSEPYYTVARRLAKDAYATGDRDLLAAVGGRSSEWKAVEDARRQNVSSEQIAGGTLTVSFYGLEPQDWDSE